MPCTVMREVEHAAWDAVGSGVLCMKPLAACERTA
jgi:hypothetical protein